MERQIINPWRWQDAYGFVQANEVSDAQRVLYCAGQVSVDAEETLSIRGHERPDNPEPG